MVFCFPIARHFISAIPKEVIGRTYPCCIDSDIFKHTVYHDRSSNDENYSCGTQTSSVQYTLKVTHRMTSVSLETITSNTSAIVTHDAIFSTSH